MTASESQIGGVSKMKLYPIQDQDTQDEDVDSDNDDGVNSRYIPSVPSASIRENYESEHKNINI